MVETTLIIIEQALLHLPLILGSYISISLMKTPDLSLDSSYVFGAFCASLLLPYIQGIPFIASFLLIVCASLCGGAFVGLTSSLLTQKARIPHLLSSLITIGIFHGVTQLIAGVYVSLSGYKNILEYDIIPLHPELPILVIICSIFILAALYFLKTQLGYCLAVFGSNPSFFAHYGIATSYVFISGIIIANALAGLSGYLFAQSNGFADISMGFGKLLLCVTALTLGKVMQRKKIVSVFIPIVGTLGYFTLQQLLLKVGFDLRYFTMIQAIVIVIILTAQYKNNETLHIDHLGV